MILGIHHLSFCFSLTSLLNFFPHSDESLQGMMAKIDVLPEGFQLRFKDDKQQVVLFPYSALTLCAAVRCVKTTDDVTKGPVPKFVSLTSPEAGGANSEKPAIFTAITRRTKGRQVLECHGFITMHPQAALDLVRWVNQFDRKAKQENYASVGNQASPRGAFETSTSQADISFGPDGVTDGPDFPVQIVPGVPTEQNAPPDFYKEPPRNGYFYATKSAQVKKYSLQKMSNGGGAETIDSRSAVGGAAGVNGDESFHPGSEYFDGPRGYAGSTMSAPAYSMPPRHPFMMRPMFRPGPPMYMRPMMYGPPPSMYGYPRPRFFSPPPGVMPTRPVPVLIPGPPPTNGYFPGPRRDSRGSSPSDRSSSPGSPRPSRGTAKSPKQNGGAAHVGGDSSDDEGSRPRSPPTDYEGPSGPRVSRKDDYYLRQSPVRGVSPTRSAPLNRSFHAMPHGYYMMPPYGYFPPHPGLVRARSVPHADRGKDKKSKKKKSKKDKKKKKGGYSSAYDESAEESMGYQSELGPAMGSHKPRDFLRMENQFQHERAFSKSLAEQARKSTRGEPSAGNAYNLNPEASDMPLF